MSTLVQLDPKNVTATYDTKSTKLIVIASGVPSWQPGASFKQDKTVPGIKLRLEAGFSLGLAPDDTSAPRPPVTVSWDTKITALTTKSLSVVLADSKKNDVVFTIPIAFDPPAPVPGPAPVPAPLPTPTPAVVPKPTGVPVAQPMPDLPIKPDQAATILQVINVDLFFRGFVRIMSPLPDPAVFRYAVEGSTSASLLSIWRAGELAGQAYWDLNWPQNDAMTRASFTVTTTKRPIAQTSGQVQITVQPYVVNRVSAPPVMPIPNPANLVDLFDPNA